MGFYLLSQESWLRLSLMLLLATMLFVLTCSVISVRRRLMNHLQGPTETGRKSKHRLKRLGEWISSFRNKGEAKIPGLGITVVCIVIALWAVALTGSGRVSIEETHYNVYLPHVPEMMPDDEYIVWNRDPRDIEHFGDSGRWVFCKQPKRDERGNEVKDENGKSVMESVPFDEGELLLVLTFKEYGSCKMPTYYRFLLDSSGKVAHAKEN